MTMLKLDPNNLIGTEGSGNQKKIWIGNKLIKLNSKYKEANKEVSAYKIAIAFGLDAVCYVKNEYLVGNVKRIGCECLSFVQENEDIISLATLLNLYNLHIPSINASPINIFNKIVGIICEFSGLSKDFVQDYLLKLVTFDFLICNPDRHLNNIDLICNMASKTFRFAPIYDNGQSFLLSDGGISDKELERRIYKFKSKPFSTNPYRNLIDLNVAKNICYNYIQYANTNFNGIYNLTANEFHNRVVIKQIQNLMNK